MPGCSGWWLMGGESGLRVGRYLIPEDELSWTFGPSGGPGGQHANRSNTRAELRFDVAGSSAFPEDLKVHLIGKLGRETVWVVADRSRSQWQNRRSARSRLAGILEEAMKRPKRRRPTKPTAAARRVRLEQKRLRAATKRSRQRPTEE